MAVITNPTNGQATPITNVDELAGLVDLVTRFEYSGSNVSNRYETFDKTPLEFGAIIESVRVPATGSKSVDENSVTEPAANFPKFAKRYISAPQKKTYYVDITYDHLRRVVDGQANFDDLVATIINANNEGERRDANAGYKQLFSFESQDENQYIGGIAVDGICGPSLITGGLSDNGDFSHFMGFLTKATPWANKNPTDIVPAIQYERLENPTFEQLWAEIKRIAKDMTFDNSTYSNGYQCECRMEDLVLVIPAKTMDDADVKLLANVKNLEKDYLVPTIHETDGNTIVTGGRMGAYTVGKVAIICDRRALGRVVLDRHTRSRDIANDKRRFELYVTDEFYFDPNYKCYAIIYDDPVADTLKVNVTNTTTAPVNTKEVTA